VTSSGSSRPPPSLDRGLLAEPTLEAARAILGALLVRDDPAGVLPCRVGRIVEVEAYIGEDDRASHARAGRTPRNEVMFGPPGIAYVYLVYGMHHCLNIVTETASRPAALLIRAVEPVAGADAMRTARAGRHGSRAHCRDARLTAGPGLVCAALGVDRACNGLDLCDPRSPLRLEAAPPGAEVPIVAATPRVGIAYAGEPWTSLPWRLLIPDSPSLSRPGR
jgi:DNA-3-methyladenine glycosylase